MEGLVNLYNDQYQSGLYGDALETALLLCEESLKRYGHKHMEYFKSVVRVCRVLCLGSIDQMLEAINLAQELLKQLNEHPQKGFLKRFLMNMLSVLYWQVSNYEQGLYYMSESERLIRQCNPLPKKELMILLLNKGVQLNELKNISWKGNDIGPNFRNVEASVELLREAVALGDEILKGCEIHIRLCYTAATVMLDQARYDLALDYFSRAVKMCEKQIALQDKAAEQDKVAEQNKIEEQGKVGELGKVATVQKDVYLLSLLGLCIVYFDIKQSKESLRLWEKIQVLYHEVDVVNLFTKERVYQIICFMIRCAKYLDDNEKILFLCQDMRAAMENDVSMALKNDSPTKGSNSNDLKKIQWSVSLIVHTAYAEMMQIVHQNPVDKLALRSKWNSLKTFVTEEEHLGKEGICEEYYKYFGQLANDILWSGGLFDEAFEALDCAVEYLKLFEQHRSIVARFLGYKGEFFARLDRWAEAKVSFNMAQEYFQEHDAHDKALFLLRKGKTTLKYDYSQGIADLEKSLTYFSRVAPNPDSVVESENVKLESDKFQSDKFQSRNDETSDLLHVKQLLFNHWVEEGRLEKVKYCLGKKWFNLAKERQLSASLTKELSHGKWSCQNDDRNCSFELFLKDGSPFCSNKNGDAEVLLHVTFDKLSTIRSILVETVEPATLVIYENKGIPGGMDWDDVEEVEPFLSFSVEDTKTIHFKALSTRSISIHIRSKRFDEENAFLCIKKLKLFGR